ncbi:LysR family transcriptional regulator [Nevskia sp.]|uniref:LysR family transcriptional regulator n=1 Tax=Nevskia sp. TaxID=1929292 RepID=UPI0025E96A02|nr:LysR family transcriptional regulator [Nevskia sp.]
MDRLLWMTCFIRAVETGSLTAVARELGIGQPNVSRHLASLEAQIGTRLMHRSTRKLSLTPEGERYYAEVRPALDALREAESNARGEDHPAGLLRVSCPVALARYKILPLVKPFLARYPDISLDLQIGDRMVDLVEEAIDVAIRVGDLRDSVLRARRIGTARRVCVASTDYLAARGVPLTPLDLPRHDCVLFSLLATGAVWPFELAPVQVSGRVRVNSPEGVRAAVLDGLGIAMMPVWLFAAEIASGQVQVLMPEWRVPPLPIHALYPDKRLLPRRARVFIDLLAAEFADDPMLCGPAIP